MAPRSGAEIKRTAVLHTVTQARSIGTVVLHARQRQEHPIPALVASQGGCVLFEGKNVSYCLLAPSTTGREQGT